MPSAIHIGGGTARVITRAGPAVVRVVAAAAVEANQAVAAAAAAVVAAVVRIPAAGAVRIPVAAHTSRLQPHPLPAPNRESLTVKYRPRGGPS